MGNPNPLPQVADQTSFEYTSTRSIFQFDVGGLLSLEVLFLSPISPNDLSRQSAPVSYLSVSVSSKDGNDHDVQIYTDVSAGKCRKTVCPIRITDLATEWASGDRSQQVEWSYSTAGDTAYHQFARQTQAAFSEQGDQAEWGDWYYAASSTDSLTHKSGADTDVRSQFANNGALDNSADSAYRAINDRYPVFGFSDNIGLVGSSSKSSLFTIFHAQAEAAQFNTGSGLKAVPSYWREQHSKNEDALAFFHDDFKDIHDKSVELDAQVSKDAERVGGQDYVTMLALAARQAWAATQVAGTSTDPYIFMKEISSNGNMNTVDVIYPSSPLLMYFNPSWLKLLLDPVYIVMENGLWPEEFSIHDIGFHYPNATGHASEETQEMPV